MLRQVPVICSGHTRAVVQVRFSGVTDHGYFLISASIACERVDGFPMLRDGRTGDWIGTFQGHKGAVWGASITRDAQRALTASADFTARLWDSITGDEIRQFEHRTVVREAVFSTDALTVLTGAQDKKVRIWDIRAGREPTATLAGFSGTIRTCSFLQDSNQHAIVASGNELSMIDVRNCGDGAQSESASQAKAVNKIASFDSPVTDFDIKDQKMVVACGTAVELLTVAPSDGDSSLANLQFSRSARYTAGSTVNSAGLCDHCNLDFAAACEDNNVFRYDSEAGAFQVCKAHSGKVHCVRFSPDGHLFASAADDGTIRLWQHTVGEEYGLWKVERNDE